MIYIWIIISILGTFIIFGIVTWINGILSNSKQYLKLKDKLENLEKSIKEHESEVLKNKKEWKIKVEKWEEQVKNDKKEIHTIAKQKSMGFPWLAKAYADYFSLKDNQLEKYLQSKKFPAYTTAEHVKKIKQEKNELLEENKLLNYQITYIEYLFPWLREFITDTEDQEITISLDSNKMIEIINNSTRYLNILSELKKLDESIKEHESKVSEQKKKIEEWEYKKKLWLKEYDLKTTKEKKEWESKKKLWEKEHDLKIKKEKKEIHTIAKQKSMGFPWLAEAYADYFLLKDNKLEEYLESKKFPAYKAAEHVKKIKQEKRELIKENKLVNYKITYFEKLFPWLSELISDDENEDMPVYIDIDNSDKNKKDRVADFLTQEEYQKLPAEKRNQIALDRYLKSRHKSKWAIGRDYEMYVGYLYEKSGYSIEYKGIIDGFEDLGRDVIATKENEVCIIQCKYWAQYKEIHEKHIFQLFGTTMEYWLKNYQPTKKEDNSLAKNLKKNKSKKSFKEFAKILKDKKIRPIFFTSTRLSNKAKEMANALNIEIREKEKLGEFPRIKCNLNRDKNGKITKIYHLPMDQQYDKTKIRDKGEFYAFTVQEAVNADFRRAWRWHAND